MNPDKRVIVYPAYIDSAKTVAEGRRIPKHLACSEPFAHEMHDCCATLNVRSEIEAKHYPRDWIPKGRLRVQLKGDDGQPLNPEIPDRRTLLIRIAELVPKHPNKTNKAKQGGAKQPGELGGAGAGPSGSGAGNGAGGSGSSSKPAPSKKGKKGKK